ncbi:MAG: SDR family oxidoreductase [Spirochaetales bacterium]|nr:SDR family oxidoreductase [Spirochaetales bacterium]
MTVNNRVVWITGASSGIGEALAYEFHKKGARVVISARNKEKLDQISQSLGENCYVLPLDMMERNSFGEALESVLQKWGRIDILINNAGISQRSLVADTDITVVEKIMMTNYVGPAGLTGLVIPHMIERNEGYCLFVSSVAGKFATPLRSSYAASKMALQGFTDSLRAEVHHQGIRVSLIVPGFVKTAISLNALEGKGNQHGLMDPNQERGISAEQAAKIIVKGIEKEKREIYLGMVAKTRFALFLSRYIPSLLAVVMRKAKVT